MAATARIAFICFVAALPLFAQPQAGSPPSRYEIQRDLFASDLRPESAIQDMMPASEGKKSVGLAVLYSLALPGMGELYADGFSSGKYFLIAEAVLWLGYTGADLYGNALRDDARTFSEIHAGVNPTGKDDQFFIDIGNFLSVDAYNDKHLRDRDVENLYDPLAGYAWTWESDAARTTYKDERIKSENFYNSRKFIGAAILINHIASAINAARAAISHNSTVGEVLGDLRVSADVMGTAAHPHGVRVNFTRSF
jgi:hypothetical protein